MRNLSTTLQQHLDARSGLNSSLLVWLTAIEKATGQPEQIGFWTGPTDQDFDIEGQIRTYVGVGAVPSVPAMQSEIGLTVRQTRLQLNAVHPDVMATVTLYDLRQQAIQLHVAYSAGIVGNLIDAPVRVYNGIVAEQPSSDPEPGGEFTLELVLLSSAFHLTRSLALRKSDDALQARAPNDRFRRYADVSGFVETVWGSKRAAAPTPKPESKAPVNENGGPGDGAPF